MRIIIPILIIFSLLTIFLIRNFTGMFVGTESSNIIFEWWNSSYTFRIGINFTSYNVDRINWPIELKLNFTEIINSFGFNGTFDENSIRVLEYSNEGKVLYLLPYQFDKDENFDAYRNAYGELIFIANGTTYANTSRIFFVYFDILENGKKEKIEFPSNLSYYIQGNLLIINTTAFNYEIELNYSGIVGIRNIFSNSQGYYLVQTNDYPFEYTLIYDEFGAKNSFLFNESLKIVSGPIRIKLIFNGTEFNVDSGIKKELIGNKIYKFYENVGPDINNFGIFKVEQKFINPTSNILNRSSDFVFGFDLYRGIVRTTTYVTDVTGNSEDPYSYGYAVQSIPATTVAIINFNETNTQNFYAYYDNVDTNQRIKINLNNTQIIDFISHEAISMISFGLYQGQYDYFYQYLYPAIVNPVSIELYPEYRKVLIGVKTDYNFYNLNETIKIFAYPIDDLYNLTNKIVLEIKRENKVDYIEAFDNGYGCDEKANDKIFSACFLIPKDDYIGIWNITAYAYESTNDQLLATNYTLINVTNKLNVEVYATKKVVEVLKEQEVLINVKNYRNDTYLSNANITCYEDNQKIENYVLIDYLNGSYLFKYNVSIYPGIHTINCSAEWNNNFGSNLDYFDASAPKTYLDLVFIPQKYVASKITWYNNESFEIEVIINNTFSGYAYDVNLSVILPNNFEANSTFEKCDEIKSFGNCTFGFWINVKEKTIPNTYYINFSVKWKSIDESINETYKLFEVNVLSNSILDVDPKNFSSFTALNVSDEIGKITLYSTGNAKVTNISFSHTFDFNLTFYPNITELDAGKSSIVKINASIPFGYKPGYYNGIINVSYNSGYQIVNVTIIIAGANISLEIFPEEYIAKNVTSFNNESFEAILNISNYAEVEAFYSNLTVILPNNFVSNVSFIDFGNFSSNYSISIPILITIKELTYPGIYYINFTFSWYDVKISYRNVTKIIKVIVEPNYILNVSTTEIFSEAIHGIDNYIGYLNLSSTGNAKVTNISFSHTFDFNLTFYPNITELDAGKSSIVKINASIPFGYKPGYYNGIINVSYNSGYQIVNVTINVLENRSWIVDKTNCSAYFYPPYGKVCDINITNIGNVEINFNVIPINKNYTWIENESFKILPTESFNLSIYYNVTNAPLEYIYEYYNLTSDGIPKSLLINITIYPFIGAEGFLEIVPNSSSQNSTLKIFAKVFEKVKVGIEYVKIYIQKPDKELEEMFLEKIYENDTYSEWYANFSNTSLRGIYNVTLEIKNKARISSYNYSYFYIYPLFLTSVNTLKKEYMKGQDISITYFTYDFLKNPIENVEVEITVKNQNFTVYKNVFENVNGTIEPIITFKSSQDWPEGNYTVIAKSKYFDSFLNDYLYSYSENWFLLKEEIKEAIFTNLETSVIWYPEGVMKFSITFFDSSGNSIDPDYAELKVLDPAENIYFVANISQFKREAKGFYVYKYAIPPNTATGAYLAILNFTKGNISSITSKMFRVSAGGPFDLKIKALKKEVNRGETLPIEVTVINMGEVSMDVFLEYWIVDSNGNRYYYTNEWIYIPSLSQKTFLRELYIFSNQPLGLHYAIASLTYDKVKPPLIVNESFFVIEKISPKPISIPTAPAPIPIQEIKPLNYSIKIIYIPEEMRIEVGGNRMFTVAVKNFGNANLTKVKLYINGLPFNFYKILQEYELIEPNETKLFDIIINIPKEEKVREYNFSVLVISKEGAKDERFSKLVIFESFEKLIEYEILLIKEKLERLKIEVEIARKEKRDISKVELKIKEIEKGIEIVQNLTSRKFYREAYEKIIELRSLIEEAFYLLSIAPKIFSIKEFLISFFISNLHYILFGIFSTISLYLILKIFEKAKMEKRIAEKAKREIYEVIKQREEKVEIDFEKMEEERIKKILELIEKDYRSGKIPKEIYEKLKEKYLNKLKNVK